MDITAQARKAEILRKLHIGPPLLVLPNAWDVASACVLEELGYPAIATTSAGVAFALGYPEATEEFPWGDRVVKVKGKVFVFMGSGGDAVGISVKLPLSAEDVLALSFTERTRYGLGQHGWVTARFEPDAVVPIELLKTWIDESYRAVAPKRLVAQLPAGPRLR